MIRDQDLNNLKNGLKTYFEFNPLGPRSLQLNYDMARKLLNLLENLDELNVDNIINHQDFEFFPENELMTYVKKEMARKIADKLVEDGYVEFVTSNNKDDAPFTQRLRASVIVLKHE